MKEYRCPPEIKDLYLTDPEKAFAKSYEHIKQHVLPKIRPGDAVEAPDGKWLVKTLRGGLQ